MKLFRIIFYLIFSGAISGSVLTAQVLARPQGNTQFWNGDRLVTFIAEKREIRLEEPRGKTHVFPLPKGTIWKNGFFQNKAWVTTRKRGLNHAVEFQLLSSGNFISWELAARFLNSESTFGYKIVPLENGDFFLMSFAGEPINLNGQASLFAIAGVDSEKNIKIKSLIEPGFKTPLFQKPKKMPGGELYLNSDLIALGQLAFDPINPAPIGDNFFLASLETGFMLVFSGKNGNLIKKFTLYKCIDEKSLAQSPTHGDQIILAILPKPNGSALIISRTEDAILNARKVFGFQGAALDRDSLGLSPEADAAALKQAKIDALARASSKNALSESLSLQAFPFIEYQELDSKEYTFSEVPVPTGFPTRITRPDILSQFAPRVNVKGVPELGAN